MFISRLLPMFAFVYVAMSKEMIATQVLTTEQLVAIKAYRHEKAKALADW